jgi:hypothetical protein
MLEACMLVFFSYLLLQGSQEAQLVVMDVGKYDLTTIEVLLFNLCSWSLTKFFPQFKICKFEVIYPLSTPCILRG